MKDCWDPKQYLKFSSERSRPAYDLLNRIQIENPKTICDLGCGTGDITNSLKERWPKARAIGLDSSAEMLKKAKAIPAEIEWIEADINQWTPQEKYDLLISNATLQWLDNHDTLFPHLSQYLTESGVLAVQMPNNYDSPAHLGILQIASLSKWKDRLLPLLRYKSAENTPVGNSKFYHSILAPYFHSLDIWETEYLTLLDGDNPVLEWIKGTGLRPILKVLNETEQADFLHDYALYLKNHYPQDHRGKTLFPFKRIFIVATQVHQPTPSLEPR